MIIGKTHLHLCSQLFFSFDGQKFESNRIVSKYGHRLNPLGSYKGAPFAAGSPNHKKTEIFDFQAEKWLEVEDYPYARVK